MWPLASIHSGRTTPSVCGKSIAVPCISVPRQLVDEAAQGQAHTDAMQPTRMSDTDLSDGLPPSQRWRAMLAVAIAVAMSVLVTSIANIALPTIAHDMDVTPSASIWVVNAYQLAVTVTLLPFASMGDIYGHRRVYVWGLAVYTAASLLCALAPSLPALVIGRVLQGFGGAGIMSVNGALVRFIYPREA